MQLQSSHHRMLYVQVCDDTIEEDDGQGNQTIFRVIRVPFRVVFVSGNLKLRFHVQQSRKEGKVWNALWHIAGLLRAFQH